ncbi:type 1 glutamine amidotransferase domain-containing protein [Acidithiobacillus sp. AMEEHan]|uniref:type 1 glutamine amidotransferase domain-containing protein n=1 Tax=Acidithiobacillus sp. AMEEHan TaxID=2994951 RepID=UPI0027E58F68|nr:type 1 glutamine amidotransferase domain-containing protein [Acidithiobacillus sp. AMEEHan]
MLPSQPFLAFLLSSAQLLRLRNGDTIATGVWAEELLLPWQEFRTAGWPIVFLSPDGKPAQIDPQSLLLENLAGDQDKQSSLAHESARLPLMDTLSIASVLPILSAMRGVFIPGGNGPLMDLPDSSEVGRLLHECRRRKLPVATLCHGSAALLARPDPGEDRPFSGFQVSCFQKLEEEQTSLAGRWPFHLEEELRGCGFQVISGAPWQAQVVQDRDLFSGQNPASALPLAQALLARLEENRRHRGSKHGY